MSGSRSLIHRSLSHAETLAPFLVLQLIPSMQQQLDLIDASKFTELQVHITIAHLRGQYGVVTFAFWWLYDIYAGLRIMVRELEPHPAWRVSAERLEDLEAFVHDRIYRIKSHEITRGNAVLLAEAFHLTMIYVVDFGRFDILRAIASCPIKEKLDKNNPTTEAPMQEYYLPPE